MKSSWLWAALIALFLYLIHFSLRSPFNNYERPIIGDSMAYYSYLPAMLIYGDPSYSFLDEIERKYYHPGAKKQFLVSLPNGGNVNKTYPGAAIFYLPFFLIAHALALIFSDPDGYSILYQLFFDFGHFFYVFLGIGFALKVLDYKGGALKKSLLSVVIMILGTNYFYYIAFDQSLVHIHSMTAINASIYFLMKWERESCSPHKYLILSVLVMGLALITRPTNMFSVLLLLFFIDNRKLTIIRLFKTIIQPQIVVKLLVTIIACISVPILLWYWQAGVFYAYSYGEEGFDFANPQIINFLFSYNNGWLVYTPILLPILLSGLAVLFKKDKPGFRLVSIFYILSIYVFSSWWCWYYGCSFGQRTTVDFYIIPTFFCLRIIELLKSKLIIGILSIVVSFFSFLNLHQSYQNFNGYIECGLATSEMYWDNFLSFRKKAKVYLNESEKVIFEKSYSFDSTNEEVTGVILEGDEAFSGNGMTVISKEHNFSGTVNAQMNSEEKLDYIIVSFYVQQRSNISESSLVVEQPEVENSYQRYWFKDYGSLNDWIKIEYKYYLRDSNSPVRIYFWNGYTEEECWFDELKVSGVVSKK